MTDVSNVRDIIARAISDHWSDQETYVATATSYPETDAALAALDAAGVDLVPRTDQWEWGVRDDDWPGGPFVHDGYSEAGARLQRDDGSIVVRRRPAGPWEVEP